MGTHDKNIRVYQQSMTSRLTDVLNFNAAIGITINVYVTKQNKIIELPLINDFVVTPDRERMRERGKDTLQFNSLKVRRDVHSVACVETIRKTNNNNNYPFSIELNSNKTNDEIVCL